MCNRTVINIQSVSVKPAAAAENKQITVISSSSFGVLFKREQSTPYKPYNFKKRKLLHISCIAIIRAYALKEHFNMYTTVALHQRSARNDEKSPAPLAQAPRVGLIVSIVQRLDPFLALSLTDLHWVRRPIEPRCQLY